MRPWLLASLVTLVAKVQACVEVHTYMESTPSFAIEDSILIQVWYNGKLICDGEDALGQDASDRTNASLVNFDGNGRGCDRGYGVFVYNNGAVATLEDRNVDPPVIVKDIGIRFPNEGDRKTNTGEKVCAFTTGDNARPLYCTQYETCISDNQGCGTKADRNCRLCDFRGRCDDPGKAPQKKPPVKALIMGDSITAGSQGDFTWRYHIWDWLVKGGNRIEFVGPYNGVQELATADEAVPRPPQLEGEPEYQGVKRALNAVHAREVERRSDFQRKHGASWGRAAAQAIGDIEQWVRDYSPDYVFSLLGFNDLGWFFSDGEGLFNTQKIFIDNARKANPQITIVLGNVIERTFIGGRQDLVDKTLYYNSKLKEKAAQWSTPRSRVVIADVASLFQCGPNKACPDGYDGLHPSNSGDVHIAQAFSRALKREFNIGDSAINPPSAIADIPVFPVTDFKGNSFPSGPEIEWFHAFGNKGYEIESTLVDINRVTYSTVNTPAFYQTWTFPGQKWEYRVRTKYGTNRFSDWSPKVTIIADPKTAPPPKIIEAENIGGTNPPALKISWSKSETSDLIDRYAVITYNTEDPGYFIVSKAARGSTTSLIWQENPRLNLGKNHMVCVATWTLAGGGIPSCGRMIRPGPANAAIPRVSGTRAENVDPTTVNLFWNNLPQGPNFYVSGYRVWIRNINNSTDKLKAGDTGPASSPVGIGFLWPGTWNYEYCISAYNGKTEGPIGDCVIPPKYPGFRRRGVGDWNFFSRRLESAPEVRAIGATSDGSSESSLPPMNGTSTLDTIQSKAMAETLIQIYRESVVEDITDIAEASGARGELNGTTAGASKGPIVRLM